MWSKRHQTVALRRCGLTSNASPPIFSSSPQNTGNESLPGLVVRGDGSGGGGTSPVVEAQGMAHQLNTLRSVATGRTIPMQVDRSARLVQLDNLLRKQFVNIPKQPRPELGFRLLCPEHRAFNTLSAC